MKQLRLVRVAEFDDATLGVFCVDGKPMFVTLEEKWRDNAKGNSCIPKGTYQVSKHKSPSKGDCFKVHNVSGRDNILIHSGNLTKDTEGCILLGMQYGTIEGQMAILQSRLAMSLFAVQMFNDTQAKLEVV